VGGHSFGELTALHAAGRIDEWALVQLSLRRGALMADCGRGQDPGAMLAAFASCEELADFIREHHLDLVIANKNAPRQCVLSGPGVEIDRASKLLAECRVTTRPLSVSAAFHSRFVAQSQVAFRETLGKIDLQPGRIPVFSNATGSPY